MTTACTVLLTAFTQFIKTHATSDETLLDSVDPSLVHLGNQLQQRLCMSQVNTVDTVYEQEDVPVRRTFVSSERHEKISADLIADRFGIGPKRAQRTLQVTTQRGVRSAILPISRRYHAVSSVWY